MNILVIKETIHLAKEPKAFISTHQPHLSKEKKQTESRLSAALKLTDVTDRHPITRRKRA